ncbi:MAG: ectB [Bacteroidetes bacterium]|jgi:diaminobutyrate-2-oxoglutarate transaminase|nr:ectB [Bacteroidota bacterium]
MEILKVKRESNVNSYAKAFPTVFESSEGDILTDHLGKTYIDFFSGAGALNYGHNNPILKKALISFIESNAVVHCLDMDSKIKEVFLENFDSVILSPRGLNYKVQFTGPTGTNAVEAAVKLVRKVTGRKKVIAFTSSFHGMTATSMALSGLMENQHAVNPSQDVVFFPYEGFLGKTISAMEYMKLMINSKGSGVELPAAIIMETVQAEGGVNVAGVKWLKELREFTEQNGILMIVDDIQAGCGRTGSFFSFERAGIVPDIVLLSKSISGYGLPLSLLLMKPQFDIWKPGEHNGTFRSNNLALCTANTALGFWKDDAFEKDILHKSEIISTRLNALRQQAKVVTDVRGIGLIWGIEFTDKSVAKKVADELFSQGMLIEVCGNNDNVLKLLSPLTISIENLEKGLTMIKNAVLT